MFPFERKTTFTFDTSILDKQEVINRFVEQFDEVEQNSTSISFGNFKTFYKRHKWLKGGQLSFDFQDKQLNIDLQLNFYYVPVLFVFVSIALTIIHWERIHLAGLFISVLWLIYGLMFIWTSMIHKSAIKNTMRRYISADKQGKQSIK